MELNKPFRARIAGADFSPHYDEGADYVLLNIAVPKDTRIPAGIVEITLLEKGGIGPDMLDTELSPERTEP